MHDPESIEEKSGKSAKKEFGIVMMVLFLLSAGFIAGYPAGQWNVRRGAAEAVSEIKRGYDEAAAARIETLQLCLANQNKAIDTAAEAAKVAGNAAIQSARATDAAAKAVDTAKQSIEEVRQR